MRKLLAGLLVGLVMGGVAPVMAGNGPHIPACAEDQLVDGVGNFDGRYWDDYRCFNVDDYVARVITRETNYQVDGAIQGDVCNHSRYFRRNYGVIIEVAEACEGH